jgi:hypothetical protein
MAMVPIESDQACVSRTSLVDFGGYAIYASPDGLVRASGNTAELMTGEFFDKDSWETFLPETIRAYPFEGKYLAFYGDVADGNGFVFDPNGGKDSFVTLSDFPVSAAYYEQLTDLLTVAYVEDSTYKLGDFNEGDVTTYTRRTKKFMYADPVSLNCVRIEADSYPISFELIADGVSRGTWTFPDNEIVKLPGGYRAREYQFEVRGSGEISGIYISDSMAEMV